MSTQGKEPIAIVGIGCRFPGGVSSPDDLHRFLLEKRSAIGDVPADRWAAQALFHPDPLKPAHIHVRRGGFLSQVAEFDCAFFGISPNEARRMDPQQRLVLETAFEALEDAGARLEDLAGRAVAVVIGVSGCDYDSIVSAPTERANINGTTNTGLASSIVANRLSYLFDLRGPSFIVDTACSSSLTAVHQACRAIWEGAAQGALAGGVNLMLKPSTTIGFSKGAYLSPDAECRAFSDHANGYVRSEGAGVVYLKRLSAALSDGDRIHALIRGTWINQDGKTPGMTMPSQAAQEELLEAAYRDAGVDPQRVAYVEAHGTGTPAGDPVEANAIGRIIGLSRPKGDVCHLGSVKTNLGHLESAAGMAGLIKLVLVLKHRTLFPNLHFRAPNPKIPFQALNLEVPTEVRALSKAGPLFGGVNAFGFGGANAHAVLESPPEPQPKAAASGAGPQALFLSARSASALRTVVKGVADALPTAQDLGELCDAWSRRKSRFEFRVAAVGETGPELAENLRLHLDGKETPSVTARRAAEGSRERVVLVFSGQGGQWWGMGRALLEHEPVFRRTVEQIDALFRRFGDAGGERSSPRTGPPPRGNTGGERSSPRTGPPPRGNTGGERSSPRTGPPPPGNNGVLAELTRDEAHSRMAETEVAQPALFALEVGLWSLLRAHGVVPAAVVGHSIGELAAAHVSGALTLEEAARIVYWRSRCQAQAEGKGSMAVIGATQGEVQRLLAPYRGAVEIAALNGPSSITVAGTRPEVEALVTAVEASGVFCRRLNVSVPFHCRLMDPIEPDFRRALEGVQATEGHTPYFSTVTGARARGAALDLGYWWRNIREPVHYAPALAALLKEGFTTFVEVGPSPSLKQGSAELAQQLGARISYVSTLSPKGDQRRQFVHALGQLFTAGAQVESSALRHPMALALPHHPFERQTQWLETAAGRAARLKTPVHPHVEAIERRVKARELFSASLLLDAHVDPYLADHRVQGLLVFPGAGQLEVAQAAATAALDATDLCLEDVEFRLPLVIGDGDGGSRFKLEVYSDEGHFQIASEREGQWTEHSRGRIQRRRAEPGRPAFSLGEVRARVRQTMPIETLFREAASAGLELGPAFRGIRELWESGGETLARVEAPAQLLPDAPRYLVHPAVLDAVIQTAALGTLSRAFAAGDTSGLFLPHRVARFELHPPAFTGPLWCYARAESSLQHGVGSEQRASVWAVDAEGRPVVTIEGLVVRRVQGSARDSAATHPNNHYRWEWKPVEPSPLKARPKGTWLVLGDANEPLVRAATAALPGPCVSISAEEHLRGLKKLPPDEKIAGLVHLWLDGSEDVELAERRGPLAVSQWAAALAQRWSPDAEVWLITRQVHSERPRLAGASLWGLGRVLMSELPHLSTTLVDVDGDRGGALLVEQLSKGPHHHELKLSSDGARTHVLARISPSEPRRVTLDSAREPFRAVIGTPGVLQSIALERHAPRPVGPHDVEIAVRAVGLNFKDVVAAMGLLPAEAWKNGLSGAELGIDCAGVVTQVGEKVTRFRRGDEVVGCAASCMGNRAVSSHHLWAKKPAHLSFEQGASLPTIYCTAVIGLEWLGRLSAGESVLIHAGAGGVGIAAIAVARRLGARVLTTTSSEEKRAYLRSLGVEHVFNSRSGDFREGVLAATEGRGVDVVLNSLAGRQLTEGIRCLSPFGRFIEIGKADIYSNRQVGLEFFGENRSYQVLDLNRWVKGRPEQVGERLQHTMARVSSGELPVPPLRIFPIQEAAQAVQTLSQGRHIGKVVVSVPSAGPIEVRASPRLELDGTYLVTGGTRGFGLEIGRWLAERGAKHLVLASRSGAPEGDLASLRALGAQVEGVRCDVSDREQVRALIGRLPKLAGVFHCAMVLDDGPLTQLDAERFQKVSRPKALGAWHLHEATAQRPLEHFVLVSSIASVIGTPGQGSYAAANAVLDRLAELRRASGLEATVLNFGVLDTGVVARASPEQKKRILSQGVTAYGVDEALAAMEQVLVQDAPSVMLAHVNWERLSALGRSPNRPPRFEGLSAASPAAGGDGNFKDRLFALPAEQRPIALAQAIAEHVAAIAGLKERADTETGLGRFGLDSLMSVQLQSWLQNRVGVTVPLMRILRGPSIRELSSEVLSLADRAGRKPPHAWLKQVRAAGPFAPTGRVFCFSYMTADGDAYQGWAESLHPSVELWTITYPDLGGELDALLRGPAEALRRTGADELMALTDLPYAFYGHSMGGFVALDLACELEARGRAPRFVAVGALPTLETMRSIVPQTSVATPEEISDDFVVQVMNRMQVPAALLNEPAFREQALARTRRDLWLGVQGQFQRTDKTLAQPKCPVWLFGGNHDPIATADKRPAGVPGLEPAGVVEVSGGHLFVEQSPAREQVAQRLSAWLTEDSKIAP
jgi:acyl transferase domain-containing protein/NADPH:quinone reductase-like Zn-dependent oxidoreductase/surfactin synthase thioesterase subunit